MSPVRFSRPWSGPAFTVSGALIVLGWFVAALTWLAH